MVVRPKAARLVVKLQADSMRAKSTMIYVDQRNADTDSIVGKWNGDIMEGKWKC